jgi:hypothetical protein
MVYAVAMVKDEADIIAESVGWMLTQVDKVVVMDNGSTDGTREILADLDVTLIDDPEVGYYQSRKMSRLAELCRDAGAEWVVPFDADEIHRANTHSTLRAALLSLPEDVLVCESRLFDHVATGLDGEGAPVERMKYRRAECSPLRKVAVRAVEGVQIHQGNHSATFPDRPHPKAVTSLTEVRHFPYRSVGQFVSKVRNGAAAYAASDLPESAGSHWRQYGKILDERGEDGIAEIFHTWFYRENPNGEYTVGAEVQPGLVFDPCRL